MDARPVVLALISLSLAVAGCSRDPKPAATTATLPAHAELGVEQLAKSPATFAGRLLALRGVVSFASAADHRFVVIDEAEYRSCRELTCSAYEVPVAFTGALPDTAQSVRIVGRLAQPESGRFLVQADSVEVLN